MSNLKQDLDRIRERISDPSFLKNEGLCNEVGIHIQDVDHCTVISSHIIDSPILGAITPRELSGGVKVLILMLKDDSFVYNMSNCGDNCAKWILKIAEKKDLTVYLQHIMRFEGEFKIQIMNTGKIVCNSAEYVEGLLEAEEMEDERKLLV